MKVSPTSDEAGKIFGSEKFRVAQWITSCLDLATVAKQRILAAGHGPLGHFSTPSSRKHSDRSGNILLLTAFFLSAVIAMLAFAIDVGYMYTMRTQLTRSVDAAALAGAGSLLDGQAFANDQVVEYLVRNPVGGNLVISEETDLASLKAMFLEEHEDELEITLGHWNTNSKQLENTSSLPSAVEVSMAYPHLPTFFGKVFGRESFAIESSAVATYQPRDIMLVLDFSASMNDDSELKSIDHLGQAVVEDSIYQMWLDLEEPTYGNLEFEPDWVTIPYVNLPAEVTWRGTEVEIAATENISRLRLYKSSSSYKQFKNVGTGGTFSYNGKLIHKCKLKINNQWETISFFDGSHIRRGLELDSVPYPSEGSWDDYIAYASSHKSSMSWYDPDVEAAGHLHKFGGLTLINFWNRNKPQHSQTPSLCQVSAQPVTAVKNAVDLFMEYVREVDVADHVGLAIYCSPNGEGLLESPLTDDLDGVAEISRMRQAGHYNGWTNIGAGMTVAREELVHNARAGAYKMIVLMTDGQANWCDGRYHPTAAQNYVLDEASLCQEAKIPIITISLGANADTGLMQEVAETTEGTHFNIPGGTTIAQYSEELLDVFRAIANDRPLKLVH